MPWVMIVDSSATIGFLAERASATSAEKSRRSAGFIIRRLHRGRPQSAPGAIIGNLRSGSMAGLVERAWGRAQFDWIARLTAGMLAETFDRDWLLPATQRPPPRSPIGSLALIAAVVAFGAAVFAYTAGWFSPDRL